MTPPIAVALVVVAVFGGLVALTRDPTHQAIVASAFGVALAVLFLLLRAPDVALAEIVVGTVTIPTLLLLAIAKTRKRAGNPDEARR